MADLNAKVKKKERGWMRNKMSPIVHNERLRTNYRLVSKRKERE